MNEKKIITYISGKASAAEKAEVLHWINEKKENQQTFNRLKNAWVIANLPTHQAADSDMIDFSRKLQRRRSRKRISTISIAASLVLLLSMTALYQLNRYKEEIKFLQNQQVAELEYHTNKGIKGHVILPDGSQVWLNSDSYLRCPSKFSGDKRKIEFSGEGFFEVIKNPNKPMVIHLENGISVVVKGTRFNLSSYKNDKDVAALLLSGEITIVRERENESKEIQVKPNEKIYIEKNDKKINFITPKETLPTIGWKEGWLIFDETPMTEVIKKLERWHGINFIVQDEAILQQKFTARFKEESITQILDMMYQISLLRYEQEGATITLLKY